MPPAPAATGGAAKKKTATKKKTGAKKAGAKKTGAKKTGAKKTGAKKVVTLESLKKKAKSLKIPLSKDGKVKNKTQLAAAIRRRA
jgi:hypothetical protein